MAFLNEPVDETLAVPAEPRRARWVRPLLKAAFVVVLLLCLVSGLFLGWQRVRREQALESVLKVPPTDTMYGVPEPRSWELGRQDAVNLLKDDPHWFFSRLMKTLEQGNETQQINAVKTLDWLMPQIKSRSLRKHALETVLESLHRGAGSPGLETQLVTVASNWVDKTGVDLTRRAQIRARATASSPDNRAAWVHLLSEIGGREETLILLRFAKTADSKLLHEIMRSSCLMRTRWRGVWPIYLKHLDDPDVAFSILDSTLACSTPEGRQLRLDYVLDASHPLDRRQYAIQELQETVAGVRFLQEAIRDPAVLAAIADCMGPDPATELAAKLEQHDRYYAEDFWKDLIAELEMETTPPSHLATMSVEKVREYEASVRDYQQRVIEDHLFFLRELSGRRDLSSTKEWNDWLRDNPPQKVEQQRILAIAEKCSRLSSGTLLRRFMPVRFGEVPVDCLPTYRRLAHAGSPELRYWATYVLLSFSDDVACVPDVIAQLRSEKPTEKTGGSMPIHLLRNRFAENFFWDADAWEKWWAEQTEFEGD